MKNLCCNNKDCNFYRDDDFELNCSAFMRADAMRICPDYQPDNSLMDMLDEISVTKYAKISPTLYDILKAIIDKLDNL